MKMRSLLVLVLALALVFVAACGGNNGNGNSANNGNAPTNDAQNNNTGGAENNGGAVVDDLQPEEGAKLLIWDSGEEKAFVEEMAAQFEAEYGVPVEFAEQGADKSMGQMITDGPAGVGADVFTAVHDRTGSGVTSGVILPIDDATAEIVKSEAQELAVGAVTIDGQMYGIPRAVETTAVFYNKSLVPNGEFPEDFNAIKAFAKDFNNKADNKYAYMWEIHNGYWSFGFFGGYGAYVFGNNGEDETDLGLNSESAVAAATFFQSLTEILPLQSTDVTADIKTSLFNEGKLAMNVSGPWQTQEFKKSLGDNLGVHMYPKMDNGEILKPFSGVKALYINANTAYPDAATLLARYMSSKEAQEKAFQMFGNIPANKELGESELVQNDPFASVFLEQFKNSTPMPKIDAMAQYWAPIEAALASIWNDGTDPKAAMDNMVDQMRSAINQ
ncbi:sugar ABC transporter substrate-binding protein [Marinicrinis sediminis]|uniref:Maltodextrin-binding protein n=1 Tax=Marinicrinis sediminis TaxID=1652465 RepID=A0ABW5R8V4_9BACL